MVQAPARPAAAEPQGTARPQAIVAVLALSGIMVSLTQTVVIPLVPLLPGLLGAPAADTAWAVTVTLLAGAVATPTMGRLGDMYGKRRMLLFSISMLVAGSVVAGLADSLLMMIVGRAMQGFSAGVIPLGISIMRDVLPQERLGSAIALMSASLGVGGAVGLPVAALLAEQTDWHVMFWVSAVIGVIAATLVYVIVPESEVRTGGHFDLPGSIGLSVALLCLLLPISKGAEWGWGSGLTTGFFGASALAFVLWGWWELRIREPLVDLRTTARPQVLLTNIASVMMGFAMFAMALVLPQLLQLPSATGYGLGQTMFAVGLVMAPNGLVMMAMSPVSARISARFGPKITLMAGAGVVALGYVLTALFMSSIWELVITSCVIGAGVGLAYGAMPALVMAAVPVSETAAANSLNTLMRSVGTSVSSAVAGAVLTALTWDMAGTAVPSEGGFRAVVLIGAAGALLALLIAAFLPRKLPPAES